MLKIVFLVFVTIQIVNCITPLEESRMAMEDIIRSNGYPIEKHFVTTTDGYILLVHRIPYGKNGRGNGAARKPVLLQHGLVDSSFTWIFNVPGKGLGYILADAGFDVWMINFRGNTYSLGHTKYSQNENAFWNFSVDEMGLYDTPNTVDYILKNTGAKTCGLVGHSQGTQAAFVSFLRIPGFANKVNYFAALAPITTIANMRNDFYNTIVALDIDGLAMSLGVKRFLPQVDTLRKQFILYCSVCKKCCETGIEMLCGPHNGPFDTNREIVVAGHEPAGTSMKNMEHFSQLKRSKSFRMFDYGKDMNQNLYKQSTPPLYEISKLPKNMNIALFSGKQDVFSTTIDVANLAKNLPAGTLKHSQIIDNYAHVDFVWSLDANQLIYSKIIEHLNQYV